MFNFSTGYLIRYFSYFVTIHITSPFLFLLLSYSSYFKLFLTSNLLLFQVISYFVLTAILKFLYYTNDITFLQMSCIFGLQFVN